MLLKVNLCWKCLITAATTKQQNTSTCVILAHVDMLWAFDSGESGCERQLWQDVLIGCTWGSRRGCIVRQVHLSDPSFLSTNKTNHFWNAHPNSVQVLRQHHLHLSSCWPWIIPSGLPSTFPLSFYVRDAMQRQVGRMCEAAPTIPTDIRAFACVYAHVLTQISGLTEGFIADVTDIGLEAQVYILMATQAARVLEGFGAAVTWVRTFTGVLAEVILVVWAPFEGQRAVGALETAKACMHTPMYLDR